MQVRPRGWSSEREVLAFASPALRCAFLRTANFERISSSLQEAFTTYAALTRAFLTTAICHTATDSRALSDRMTSSQTVVISSYSDAEDEGIFDSGCSRSMTGNMERPDDFQEFQGGKVTFGGGEGRITGKGTIRTPTLYFENVYYDFMVPDESMVVLRVPRKHNLYTINLNNLSPRGTQAADLDSECDEQVSIVPSYPSHIIQEAESKDTSGDEVDDSPLDSAEEIFQQELARLKGQEQRATYDAKDAEELQKRASTKTVPTVSTSSYNLTRSFDVAYTKFPSPSDLGNNEPSPGIFSSSSYDDEFGADLNNLASTVEVSPVATNKVNKTTTGESAFISYIHDQQRDNHTDFQHCLFACFLSQVEPRSVAQALEDPSWVDAMQEEMQQFKFQNVWVLVDFPEGKYAIGTKWILKNRECLGIVVRKPRLDLLLEGLRQEEGIDMMKCFARVARIELSDSHKCIVQEILKKFDLECVRTATTPYEAPKPKSKNEPDSPINVHLYRSMIGSLMYLTASRLDIMFAASACLRNQVTLTTSNLEAVKKIFKYLKGQPKLGLWYPRESPFVLEAYSDSDYAGANKDRKSTTGGCQFLGRRLISWQCKKQTIVATSSTEAEYVAAANCYGQVLWIQNQLLDYGYNFMNTKIFIDNQSTICIVKNPVFHQQTKHIEIRHHFIRDANEKKLIQVLKIHTDDNVADLLSEAFDGPRFTHLVVNIGMLNP
ncbi:hypothetical protein Tco_1569282 [Tanacetum coccineum]